MSRNGEPPQGAYVYEIEHTICMKTASGCFMIRPDDQAETIYLNSDEPDAVLGAALTKALGAGRYIHIDENPEFFADTTMRKEEKAFKKEFTICSGDLPLRFSSTRS